ncbi:hypothetical protein ASG43_17685 [Aureimonas sp. Leaf454]|nr:hypothetical protein ASG43_17685 [Aureimonas sp. Leaf454]
MSLATPELVPLLISISKTMRALHGLKLAKLGFYNGQDELLMAVDEKGTMASSIADQLAIRPSTVSKMLDRLVDRGLIEKVGDPEDGRRTIIRITAAGSIAQRRVIRLRKELEEDLVKSLDEDLHRSMAASLMQCQTQLMNRLKRLR